MRKRDPNQGTLFSPTGAPAMPAEEPTGSDGRDYLAPPPIATNRTETSRRAARRIRGSATAMEIRILRAVSRSDTGLTCEEIAHDAAQSHQSASATINRMYKPRRNDLGETRLATIEIRKDEGVTRKRLPERWPDGQPRPGLQQIYYLTEAGRRALGSL